MGRIGHFDHERELLVDPQIFKSAFNIKEHSDSRIKRVPDALRVRVYMTCKRSNKCLEGQF